MTNQAYNAFAAAQGHFDRVASILDLESHVCELLRHPLMEFQFLIPVRMDSGGVQVFRGFRTHHNNARGPFMGGVRFHPAETIDTVRALSMCASWKTAVADVPLGGASGGVICDPHNLSQRELEQICRRWVCCLAPNIGPNKDIPAPDVMTTEQHMAWMLDEYERICSAKFPGFITGKPLAVGGSLGRIEATGFGVAMIIREALTDLGINIAGTTASVQGFGKVATHAIEMYSRFGGTVLSVASWNHRKQEAFTFRKSTGIDLGELLSIADRFGDIDPSRARDLGYEQLGGDAWLEQEVDILIPAALESQITDQSAGQIGGSVKLVAEGANAPTTPGADRMIASKGIFLVPDFLANAGGATCSYFEHVQSNTNYYWEKDEVVSKLDVRMTSAFRDVAEIAHRRDLNMRDAAHVVAISRVAEACQDLGWV